LYRCGAAGFITFDAHIHFYNLSPKLTSPHMMVVSDITDVLIPLPEDILVNLGDSRAVVEALLDSLPAMFKSSTAPSSCTGKICCCEVAELSVIAGCADLSKPGVLL
jgi:protein transport protein SEC24